MVLDLEKYINSEKKNPLKYCILLIQTKIGRFLNLVKLIPVSKKTIPISNNITKERSCQGI